MKSVPSAEDYIVTGKKKFRIAKAPTRFPPGLYGDKKDYRKRIRRFREELHALQEVMYAHDRFGMLLIFQAMDAAGKDGTIENVMRGVNPHGITVYSFKRPSSTELDHDLLWRTNRCLPRRGTIAIFNRSYYEEVLVCKVHSEIVTQGQRLPETIGEDLDRVWRDRYRAFRDLERYLGENGIVTLKFFLNVSRAEQRRRFLGRIDDASKNWKFAEADVEERSYWPDYMKAYETCINETATPESPWCVIPADDKRDMRLMVSRIILEKLKSLPMSYPKVSSKRKRELGEYRKLLEAEPSD